MTVVTRKRSAPTIAAGVELPPRPPRGAKPKPTDPWPGHGWAPAFLAAFAASGNMRLSCQSAGVTRQMAYKYRQQNEAFAAAWQAAEDDAVDMLEATARQRAMSISDVLLIFLLKAHRPEKYRDTIRVDFMAEARRLAAAYGLEEEEAIREAEAILKGK